MFTNAKASEIFAVLATIDPVSQGAGSVATGWIPVANFHNFLAAIQTGVMGTAATVDAKIQQAKDSSGTGAKDITGKAITQIVKASGDNKQALINFRGEDLDNANGFSHVALSITVGAAASVVGAQLLGFTSRYASADAFNQAAVVQIV